MKGIEITMPFEHLQGKHNEVEIKGENFIYSEIKDFYGIQVNFPEKEHEFKMLCVEISKKIKQLHELDTRWN